MLTLGIKTITQIYYFKKSMKKLIWLICRTMIQVENRQNTSDLMGKGGNTCYIDVYLHPYLHIFPGS